MEPSAAIESPLVQRKGRSGMVADIQKAVKTARLKPGDRLLSVQELCLHYRLSHRTVTLAMAELKRKGIIVSRPRRGYYVADESPTAPADLAHAVHRYHRMFRSQTSVRTVTMYVSDIYPNNIAAWQAAFRDFERVFPQIHVEPLFMDRHDMREIDRRHVDLVHSTPGALGYFPDRWVPFEDPRQAGYTPDELLSVFRDPLEKGGRLMGAPFAASTLYLYVNQAMLRRIGREATPFRDVFEILDLAAEFERTAARPGEVGMRIDRLLRVLELSGAIRMTAPGRCVLEPDRTRETLRRFAALKAPARPEAPGSAFVEDFQRGCVMFYWHGSYLMRLFETQPELEWSAWVEPEAPGSSKEFWQLVLAIDRRSDRQEECRELVRFLCRGDVMRRLVPAPALFPARQRLIEEQQPNVRVLPGTAAEAVRRCSTFWPVEDRIAQTINQAGEGFLRREFDLPELTRRIDAIGLGLGTGS
jgi:DNA-binding transcriptional ArsR family regulator